MQIVHSGAFLVTGTAFRKELNGDETAVSVGRAAAKLHGLVPGRDRNTYGYVRCCRISPDAKAKGGSSIFQECHRCGDYSACARQLRRRDIISESPIMFFLQR
jgi:hypothetical protein